MSYRTTTVTTNPTSTRNPSTTTTARVQNEYVTSEKTSFDSLTAYFQSFLIATLVLAVLAIVGIIIVAAVFATQIADLNTRVLRLETAQVPFSSAIALCDQNSRSPLFIHLVTVGNYAIVSPSLAVSGATIQSGGAPTIILCNIPGTSRVPLYAYTSAANDPITNSFGTTPTPPSGFVLGNNSAPLGYIYNTQFVGGISLNPVFLACAQFNLGASNDCILTHQSSPTFGGVVYVVNSFIPLGFSL